MKMWVSGSLVLTAKKTYDIVQEGGSREKLNTNLRHDDQLLAGQVQLLDRVAEDDLRLAIGVHLSSMRESE